MYCLDDVVNLTLEFSYLYAELALRIYTSTCTQVNDSECNLLELSPVAGYTVRGYAVFDGPALTGRITFVSACEYA